MNVFPAQDSVIDSVIFQLKLKEAHIHCQTVNNLGILALVNWVPEGPLASHTPVAALLSRQGSSIIRT